MASPFFSVIITAYNRERELPRAVRSCFGQTFSDFEVVVVDDGSTDQTAEVLAAIDEPRLRAVRHERNRGISPARATGVDNAAGEWMVVLDSDDELIPTALARLREVIDSLPRDVRIIRSRLRADDGRLKPGIMPTGVIGYEDRLRWCDAIIVADVASDAGHCMHRSVFQHENFLRDRRGAMETLWELELSQRERSLWIPDVLVLQHDDATNSHTLEANPSRLRSRLLDEAPDALWMADRLLTTHRPSLLELAPHYRRWLQESAATNGFLARDRRAGLRYSVAALRNGGLLNPKVWGTLALGLMGPRFLANAKLRGRRVRARLATTR